MIKDYWANLIQTAWIAVEKPMAEEKKQINWNNVCMSNTGKDVAAKRALLNTTSLIVFKQKEKKTHFKSSTFKKWKLKKCIQILVTLYWCKYEPMWSRIRWRSGLWSYFYCCNNQFFLGQIHWCFRTYNKKKKIWVLKNEQRIWINGFPNKTYKWPIGKWKAVHWAPGKRKLKPQQGITSHLSEWLWSKR